MILGKTYLKEALENKKENIYLLDALLKTAKKYIAKSDFCITGDCFNTSKTFTLQLSYLPYEDTKWQIRYGWKFFGLQEKKYLKTFKEACTFFVENLNTYATKIPSIPNIEGESKSERYKRVCNYRESLKPKVIKTFKTNLRDIKAGKISLEKETIDLIKSKDPQRTSFTAQIFTGRGMIYYGK